MRLKNILDPSDRFKDEQLRIDNAFVGKNIGDHERHFSTFKSEKVQVGSDYVPKSLVAQYLIQLKTT